MAETLEELLYPEDGTHLYALLDGAAIADLLDHLYEHEPPHYSLYRGKLEDDMAVVSPYLVDLQVGTPMAEWLFNKGWGKHWGVYAMSAQPLVPIRRHFRQFLTVYDEAGTSFLFRFYDPRVLRVYLPTCNAQELQDFFGPVQSFLMEGDDPGTMQSFRLEKGDLRQKELKVQRTVA